MIIHVVGVPNTAIVEDLAQREVFLEGGVQGSCTLKVGGVERKVF